MPNDYQKDSITKLLVDLVKPINQLNLFLAQDRLSYKLLLGEIESVELRKKKLMEEYRTLESQIENARNEASRIIAKADAEAKATTGVIKDRYATALRLLEEIKEFCDGVDRKRAIKLKEQIPA